MIAGDISVYQNYFKDELKTKLDPSFIPYDWTHNPTPEYREIVIFLDIYKKMNSLKSEYIGLLSPKFNEKTGISGNKFIEFIRKNPGYDVYFINPFPHGQYLYFNVWEQGEAFHPGTIKMAQELFDYTGFNIIISELGRNDCATAAYCNYWVGNRLFWDKYISFIKPLFDSITIKMSPIQKKKYFQPAPYAIQAPYFPFVFERMFSTLLLIDKDITSLSYSFSSEEYRNLEIIQNFRFFSKCEHEIESMDSWDTNVRRQLSHREQLEQFDLLRKMVTEKYDKYIHGFKQRLIRLTERITSRNNNSKS